jgi:hypothetical protein
LFINMRNVNNVRGRKFFKNWVILFTPHQCVFIYLLACCGVCLLNIYLVSVIIYVLDLSIILFYITLVLFDRLPKSIALLVFTQLCNLNIPREQLFCDLFFCLLIYIHILSVCPVIFNIFSSWLGRLLSIVLIGRITG